MKKFDVTDIEQAAEESEQDRRDLNKLKRNVETLLLNDGAMRVPVAVRNLVDGGVDAVVVAKTLLIGNRPGGFMYEISQRSDALDQHEQAAELWVALAIRDIEVDLGATMLVAGAVWLATQFRIDRDMLCGMVSRAAVDLLRRNPERRGYGAVDLVDLHGVGDRDSIVQSIRLAELPKFAPLEYKA